MNWGILTMYIVVYVGRTSQQILTSVLNDADVTECCPCPKNPSLGRSTGDRVLDFVSKSGKFVGDVFGNDSDGSSSYLTPNEVHPTRPSVSTPDTKEDSKPFLHPEIDLASSVLNTLRDATEDEYRDALQRDAARNAATSRNSLDSDQINVEEPLARNIVTIDFDAPIINEMSDIDAEESNVQETKSNSPQLNEEVDSTFQNTDNNTGILNKIINPIKEDLERAKDAINRDSSTVHNNIKEHLDKIFKPELRIQKPSSKMQHLRLSELFQRDPLNQNKVSDNQQIKSNIDNNDGLVDMNTVSENTNGDLQDSDTAASSVTESIITAELVNTEKIEKEAYKPTIHSKLKLGESSKDVLNRLKDSNQRLSNRLKNALKNKHINKQDDALRNENYLQQVEQRSMEQNDIQEKMDEMDSRHNANNIACSTEKDDIEEQEIDFHQTKAQVIDDVQPAETFIDETRNDHVNDDVQPAETFIDETRNDHVNDDVQPPETFIDETRNDHVNDDVEPAETFIDETNNDHINDDVQPAETFIDEARNDHVNDDVQPAETFIDETGNDHVNDNVQPAETFIDGTRNDGFSVITTDSFIEPSISTDPDIEATFTFNPLSGQLFNNFDDAAENQFEDNVDVNHSSELNGSNPSTDVAIIEPLSTEDIHVEDGMDTAPDSKAEGNNVTNNAVNFEGDELTNIDSTTDGNLNTVRPNQDSEFHNINDPSDQEEISNVADKDLQKISDKLLHEGLKNGKKKVGIDGCIVSSNDEKQLNQENEHTKESNNIEMSSATELNNQNRGGISNNIKENPINNREAPSNVEQLDMVPEASELSSKYALPLFSKPFEGFKSRTPLFKSSIVQPEPLLPSFKNNANFNSLTQQLDEMRSRLSEILNINEDGASTLFPNFNSPQMKSASSFPAATLDLPTLSDIRNNMFPNSKLLPSNGLNLNIFKLQPSPFNGLNFNSIRTKLPLKASSPLQPLKLLSTVKDRGGVLGASVALNNADQRKNWRNTIETKKDVKPHFDVENFMKRKINSISTPTHVKINRDNILKSNEPVIGFSGRLPPETKRTITFQTSSKQQQPLKSQKQQYNSRAAQTQTIKDQTSNLKKPHTNVINSNTNIKDTVIQALTTANNKDIRQENRFSKPTKTNFSLTSKSLTTSMKAATSNNNAKFSSNNRDKNKNNNDKASHDSSPLASSPLIKNIQMLKETPSNIFRNTASTKLKPINSNIMGTKKQTGTLESKLLSKTSENGINGQVKTNRKEATIPTISKFNTPALKQLDHSWGLRKNSVPVNKPSSRLWNGSKIPKIKIPLLKNSLLKNPKPFEKISTVEIINPFSKDLFGSADTQTPSIVSVSSSSKLLNSKGKKNSLLRAVNDDCEEPVNININGLQEADDPKALKKGLLLKPNNNTLLNKVRDAIKSSIDLQLPPNEKKKSVLNNDPLETAPSNTEMFTDRPKTLSPLLEKLSRSAKKSSDKPTLENIEDMSSAASEGSPTSLCMLGQTSADDINYKCKLICSKE